MEAQFLEGPLCRRQVSNILTSAPSECSFHAPKAPSLSSPAQESKSNTELPVTRNQGGNLVARPTHAAAPAPNTSHGKQQKDRLSSPTLPDDHWSPPWLGAIPTALMCKTATQLLDTLSLQTL